MQALLVSILFFKYLFIKTINFFLDIICTRKATLSVSETSVMIKNERLRVFDVGGHKNLRMHWIPYFDDVKSIIFIVALSSYDLQMEEDKTTNVISSDF